MLKLCAKVRQKPGGRFESPLLQLDSEMRHLRGEVDCEKVRFKVTKVEIVGYVQVRADVG